MKNFSTVIIVILAIIIIFLIYKYHEKCAGKTCFDLPTHGPEWGPKYWKSIHEIADMIPCSLCHDDGVSLFRFAHDLVNLKTQKPLFYPENFLHWKKHIASMNDDGIIETEQSATVAPRKLNS